MTSNWINTFVGVIKDKRASSLRISFLFSLRRKSRREADREKTFTEHIVCTSVRSFKPNMRTHDNASFFSSERTCCILWLILQTICNIVDCQYSALTAHALTFFSLLIRLKGPQKFQCSLRIYSPITSFDVFFSTILYDLMYVLLCHSRICARKSIFAIHHVVSTVRAHSLTSHFLCIDAWLWS